mmetsp:Transcript_35354/g.89511  ORF Transcript_35354/g.89511 Transcript_35354/m.89511 type:complete len:112 (-) Transcript_35354:500-835(-)|eukprot:CAMPEP_0202869120 /NCGR_PEP_ID=MMETSP1391-20130828/11921_1 /ASSEMBLY_ACC=CAM_ASM_000867 /TAXON_ID=1034604 /ORGANISM="Chlamydomonas leiostraca, Strain SAG 11-49" /LENGTH=111 /DNA_ID=CAMNT_0049549385 /DNA_START=92 /DNA_END=427 /DNA_ORIENTATION=+
MNGNNKAPAGVDGVAVSTVKVAVEEQEAPSIRGKLGNAAHAVASNWRLILASICWLALLYGVMIGYFVALYEIALAVRKDNYLRPSQSRLRNEEPPSYTEQPAFPWQPTEL